VNAGLAVIGVAVVAGAVVAVSAHEGRAAVLGLVLALIAAPLVVAPLPAALPLAARLVAAILAAYLVWIALRNAPGHAPTRASRLGWPVEGLVAAAAAVVGFGVGGAGAGGVPEAMPVGLALAALAVPPLFRPDGLQVGLGAMLLVTAVEVLRAGLAGPPSALEQLVTGGLVAAIGAAMAILVDASVATGGSLELGERPHGGARPVAEPGETTRPWYRPRIRR
jgi:hypothetical protein